MELWIRSQNREKLIRINTQLYIYRGLSDYAEGDVFFIRTMGESLGEYKTQARALEVLDEIQKILMPKTIFRFDDIIEKDDIKRLEKAFEENEPIIINKATIEHLDTYVYEMPKE